MQDRLAKRLKVSSFDMVRHLAIEAIDVLDIWTDLILAKSMYDMSRVESTEDYNTCFVLICIATFGPYLIQYSSILSMYYQKGVN